MWFACCRPPTLAAELFDLFQRLSWKPTQESAEAQGLPITGPTTDPPSDHTLLIVPLHFGGKRANVTWRGMNHGQTGLVKKMVAIHVYSFK